MSEWRCTGCGDEETTLHNWPLWCFKCRKPMRKKHETEKTREKHEDQAH